MATVVLTFTDVHEETDTDEVGTVHAAIENDTPPVDGHYTPAQMMAAAAFRTVIRMSHVPPTEVVDDGTVKPLNDPTRDSPLRGL